MGAVWTAVKDRGCRDLEHEGTVMRPRCMESETVQTQFLFYSEDDEMG